MTSMNLNDFNQEEKLWLIARIAHEEWLITDSDPKNGMAEDIEQTMKQLVNSSDGRIQVLRDLIGSLEESDYLEIGQTDDSVLEKLEQELEQIADLSTGGFYET